MTLEEKRRELIAKRREAHGAKTPLGHRYSNAVCHEEQLDRLLREQKRNLDEIAELELAEML